MTTEREAALAAVEEELRAFLGRAKRTVAARAREVHADLHAASYLLLEWLARREPVRAAAVVEALGIDKGSLSRQLQHLACLGLIERTPDPDDGRAVLVATTEEAVRRLEAVDRDHRAAADARLDDWSVEDLRSLAILLGRHNRSLEPTQQS